MEDYAFVANIFRKRRADLKKPFEVLNSGVMRRKPGAVARSGVQVKPEIDRGKAKGLRVITQDEDVDVTVPPRVATGDGAVEHHCMYAMKLADDPFCESLGGAVIEV